MTQDSKSKFTITPKDDGLYIEGFITYASLAPWIKSLTDRLIEKIPISELVPSLIQKFMGK